MKRKPAEKNTGLWLSIKSETTCKNSAHLDEKKNRPKFDIEWLCSKVFNFIEQTNWSIIEEFAYKDPIPKTTEGTEMAAQTSMGKRHIFHPLRFITLHAVAAAKCDEK